jgi:hypothetical protein
LPDHDRWVAWVCTDASTNAELVAAARAQIAELRGAAAKA